MCQFKSGEAILRDGVLEIVTCRDTDSHRENRKRHGIGEVQSQFRETYHTPLEFVPVRGLFEKADYDLVFDAGRPDWWTDAHTETAIDAMWEAAQRQLDIENRTVLDTAGDLVLDSLQSLEGVTFGEVGRDFRLDLLQWMEDVTFGEIGGSLILRSLQSLEGVTFGEVGHNLILSSLQSLDGVTLPKTGHNLYLSSLQSLDGVTFGEIGHNLYLSSLQSLDGVTLPKTGHNLYLNSLQSLDGVTFGEIGGVFYYKGAWHTLAECRAMEEHAQ